jgi:protein phosphatase PTC2/3
MYGVSSMQGWRISMEDAHATILDLKTGDDDNGKLTAVDQRLSYFGVYDGHGGDKVAIYTGDNLHKIIAKQEAWKAGNLEQALKDGFLATDRAILSGTERHVLRARVTADKFIRPKIRGRSLWLHIVCRCDFEGQDLLCTLFSQKAHMIQQLIMIQGNAGDSRAVLGIKGRAKPLSFDHKPQNDG